LGLVLHALRIELTLGRLQLQMGHTAAGRATLTALAENARARGAKLMVQEAEAALKRPR
jgi:hypothetical protein